MILRERRCFPITISFFSALGDMRMSNEATLESLVQILKLWEPIQKNQEPLGV